MNKPRDPEHAVAWESEIRRRIEEIDRGEVRLLDEEEADRLMFGQEQAGSPDAAPPALPSASRSDDRS